MVIGRILILILAGCASAPAVTGAGSTSAVQAVCPVAVGDERIAVELVFPEATEFQGDVPFEVVVRNASNQRLAYDQAEEFFAFDLIVSHPWGKDIWSKQSNGAVTSAAIPTGLDPGKELHFSYRWKTATENNDNIVFPGTYCVHAVYFFAEGDVVSSYAVSSPSILVVH